MLTGRVLSETNVPLAEANISLAETPYRVLAQTNISGYFTAFNVCTGVQQELFITKAGFVPTKKNSTSLTLTTANVVAKLEIAGKFQLKVAPYSFTIACALRTKTQVIIARKVIGRIEKMGVREIRIPLYLF